MRFIGAVLLILSVFCSTSSDVRAQGLREFPPGIEWQQTETDHFIIVFDETYQEAAQKVAAVADQIHEQVTGLLQYSPADKTYIILTDHVDFINGYANPLPNNKIGLYLREAGSGDGFFGIHSPDWLEMVLTHEYTHIVHLDMVNGFNAYGRRIFGRIVLPNVGLPMWMIEGLAVYTETKWQDGRGYHPHYAMMMRTEILEDRFKHLDQMSAIGYREWPMGTVYYLYGYFFMQYLVDTYGEDSIVQLSLKNSENPPIFGGDIFKEVYNGKKVKDLWEEWRESMRQRYEAQIAEIRTNPVTETLPVSTSGYGTQAPVFSPDNQYVYYIEAGAHDSPALVQVRLRDNQKKRLVEGSFSGNFSLSADGRKIYFCQNDYYRAFSVYSDLYELNIQSRKTHRLTHGMRAFDPAVSPDGSFLVFSTTYAGSMNLMRMDLETRAITPLVETSDHTQIAHPAFSSDGSRIAVQMWKEGGFQDIYLMNSDGSDVMALISDKATDASPVWGREDEYIFFHSDRTGVPNIFAYSLKDRTLFQVTNVLTGVFDPDVDPEGTRLAVECYSGNGMDIHLIELDRATWRETSYTFDDEPVPGQYAAADDTSIEAEQYNAFPSLLPKFWMPVWGEDEEGYQLGITTAAIDALGQHDYYLVALYGLESERFGFYVSYTNQQFYPAVTLFGSDSAHAFPDIFRNDAEKKRTYWQREQNFGVDISFPVYQTREAQVGMALGYRYNKMSALQDGELLTPPPDEGVLSGVAVEVILQNLDASIYAISPENGVLASVTYRHDDKDLGGDFTLDTVAGDARVYLEIPKLQHHVFALRAIGGMSEGDTLEQGLFQLGGYNLNTGLAGPDHHRYFLRGYESNALSGNRFALGSAEYRFPFWYPQRGFGSGWLFFDSLVGTVFYDTGNAWDGETEFNDFKHGIGGEVRLNVGLQHGAIPLTLRLGYAYGLDKDIGRSQFIYGFVFDMWL